MPNMFYIVSENKNKLIMLKKKLNKILNKIVF